MRPSPEVAAVMNRYFRSVEAGDVETLCHLFSRQTGVRMIGTDPREWWSGYDQLMKIVSAQLAEVDERTGLRIEVEESEAFEDGSIGWAAVRGVYRFTGQPELPFRLSAVLRLEAGYWRLVQTHSSAGLENEEVLGLSFTTSPDDVADSLRIEQPSLDGVAAPDGTVSIVFTDVEDSTRLAEQLGDLRWVDVLHWHHRIVVESATKSRGFVVKSMGDGYMLAFASASDAISCASRVVDLSAKGTSERQLSVRAGIHTGDAVRDLNDFYGHTVTVAARVASAAAGGEVLATRVVRELTRGRDFAWGASRTIDLKGVEEPYEVLPLEAVGNA
ncbi:MAG: nuclear transport factor 2 family protein [Acidimicrobiales bacterium]